MGLLIAVCLTGPALSQTVDFSTPITSLSSSLNEKIRIPVRVKNTSERPQTFTLRVSGTWGVSQHGYFCPNSACTDPVVGDYTVRLEAGHALTEVQYVLETGIVPTQALLKFEILAKGLPAQDFTVSVSVEERGTAPHIFQNRDIVIREIYPNPVVDVASLDYQLLSDRLSARIVLQNLLGQPLAEHALVKGHASLKFSVDEWPAGIYFYTVYVDNQAVVTRKVLVRK